MLVPNLRALIFDMDGLMVDSEPLWWKVERVLAAKHGKVWTDEMAHRCVGTGFRNTVRTMNELLGLSLGVEEGVRWLAAAFVERIGELEMKPGCAELVAATRAAGMKTAVASSSAMPVIDAVIDRFELRTRFDVLVSGESVSNAKPAPDVFLRTAELLGCDASHCVVLEDSPAGVRAGVAAAMTVIAVPESHATSIVGDYTPYVVRDLHQARVLLGFD